MGDLEPIIAHIDSRLEPIHQQLSELAKAHTALIAIQERDKHQEEEIARLNASVGEAFAVIRANKEAADARHELSKERQDKLRSEFEISRDKCTAIAGKHDTLQENFEKLSADYKEKKWIIYGIGLTLLGFAGVAKWVANDYYERFDSEMKANREYRRQNDEKEVEVNEQLKILTQRMRELHGGK